MPPIGHGLARVLTVTQQLFGTELQSQRATERQLAEMGTSRAVTLPQRFRSTTARRVARQSSVANRQHACNQLATSLLQLKTLRTTPSWLRNASCRDQDSDPRIGNILPGLRSTAPRDQIGPSGGWRAVWQRCPRSRSFPESRAPPVAVNMAPSAEGFDAKEGAAAGVLCVP
jgi:hypothetical protein